MNSTQIKEFILSKGAIKCGISPISRFEDAPDGFKPTDIYPKAKSVIVYLMKMPDEAVNSNNSVPYTHTAYMLYDLLDKLSLSICQHIENVGNHAVLIPADTPYIYWDEEERHGQGILSLRHAAFNAGLGILGRNTLLLTPEFGNMVYIGAVLTDIELDPDPMMEGFGCPPKCTVCLDSCPQGALDGTTVSQKICREVSFYQNARGFDIYDCNECRKQCVLRTGSRC